MKIQKVLLVSAGLLFAGIGTVGIFMPILPTAPFYLLTTVCFAKGSEKYSKCFQSTRLYKKHFEEFVNSRSMTLHSKFLILIIATVMLILPIWMVDVLVIRIVLVAFLFAKYWYFVFSIKTIKSDCGKNQKICKPSNCSN